MTSPKYPPAPHTTPKSRHGADAGVLTNGFASSNASRAMSLSAQSERRIVADDDVLSDRSNSFSVDLDDEGQAPAPPDLARPRPSRQAAPGYVLTFGC